LDSVDKPVVKSIVKNVLARRVKWGAQDIKSLSYESNHQDSSSHDIVWSSGRQKAITPIKKYMNNWWIIRYRGCVEEVPLMKIQKATSRIHRYNKKHRNGHNVEAMANYQMTQKGPDSTITMTSHEFI
ncbi:hypothetical protein ACJX0J_039742, partial [Zea mays]